MAKMQANEQGFGDTLKEKEIPASEAVTEDDIVEDVLSADVDGISLAEDEEIAAEGEPAQEEAPEEETPAGPAGDQTYIKQEKTNKPYWYVVYTYSGYEKRVMANLKKTVQNHGLEDTIIDVKVPEVDTIETKNGKRRRVLRKLYPGYVMVKMFLTDDSWYVVRNTRGVTGFVGPASKPIPLSEREVRAMGIDNVRISLDVKIGDSVMVTSGPFENFEGEVEAVDTEKQSVRVRVPMCGRDVSMVLDFVDVKKI